jgi:hypothetical protein
MNGIKTVLPMLGLVVVVGLVSQPADARAFNGVPATLADVSKDSVKAAKEKVKLAKQDVKAARQEVKAAKQEFKAAKLELKQIRTGGGNAVPIPGTLLLFGAGFAGLVAWRKKDSSLPTNDMAPKH